MSNLVTSRIEDGIATITMDDGKLNVLSLQMFAELSAALDDALARRAAVVLTGRPGAFSAGFDLRGLMAGGSDASKLVRTGFELAERILGLPVPVVVACNGHALAMGAFLLLSGDYRVGVGGDYKIQANEVAIGITMPFFGIEICRQRLTPAHFNRTVINAEIYRPDDAVTAGFLDRVVSAPELADVARSKAVELARLDGNARAATKLRTRAEALKAIRAAIEADADAFRVPG